MAAFTSALSGGTGNWDASATWGKTGDPPVKGTDYPGIAGDTFTITAGDTVIYNVSETNQLGDSIINGKLTFLKSISTKLTFGHAGITFGANGELDIGTEAIPIDSTATAELVFTTTGDNQKGILFAPTTGGGILRCWGHSGYYGGTWEAILKTNWTSGQTFTVTGAGAQGWQNGHIIYIQNNQVAVSVGNTVYAVTVNTVVANGSDTDVTINEAFPGTCLAGGWVVNSSRNVKIYKSGYSSTKNNLNTNRPCIKAQVNTSTTEVVEYAETELSGVYYAMSNSAGSLKIRNITVRNSSRGFIESTVNYTSPLGSDTTGLIFFSLDIPLAYWIRSKWDKVYCFCVTGGVTNTFLYGTAGLYNNKNIFTNLKVADVTNLLASTSNYNGLDIQGDITQVTNVFLSVFNEANFNVNVYSCSNVFVPVTNTISSKVKMKGKLGYDINDVAKSNTVDYTLAAINSILEITLDRVKVPSAGLVITRNVVGSSGRLLCDHYSQVLNAHRIIDNFGDVVKVNFDNASSRPVQRSGGSYTGLEFTPQSNCSVWNYVKVFSHKIWIGTGSKTYRYYVQADYSTLPATEIYLVGSYISNATTGVTSTIQSTQSITTRANSSDWSQYVEVTMNSPVAGFVTLELYVAGYESTKKIWIDVVPVIL
jgi:hypothetical protein